MTSHRDNHTTTDVKPEIIPGFQTGKGIPYDKYDMRGIAHVRTNIKDDIFMQRQLGQIFTCIQEWGQGTCKKSKPFPARAYTTLVVLVFATFSLFSSFSTFATFATFSTFGTFTTFVRFGTFAIIWNCIYICYIIRFVRFFIFRE